MGLWSYILRLTLLVKGKQKKSRAARFRAAHVVINPMMVIAYWLGWSLLISCT